MIKRGRTLSSLIPIFNYQASSLFLLSPLEGTAESTLSTSTAVSAKLWRPRRALISLLPKPPQNGWACRWAHCRERQNRLPQTMERSLAGLVLAKLVQEGKLDSDPRHRQATSCLASRRPTNDRRPRLSETWPHSPSFRCILPRRQDVPLTRGDATVLRRVSAPGHGRLGLCLR